MLICRLTLLLVWEDGELAALNDATPNADQLVVVLQLQLILRGKNTYTCMSALPMHITLGGVVL